MILRIDNRSEIPVGQQIVEGLRIALVKGELAPGDELPSVRRLALDLGVHFNTVALAYRELAREGWLTIGPRTGARVKSRAMPPPARTAETDGFRSRIEALVAKMRAQGARTSRLALELRQIAASLEKGRG